MAIQLEQLLQRFNLNEKEVTIYITSLQLGPATVYELANRSGLKRPTVYLVVDELLQKGLLTQSKKYRKKSYAPLSPEQLVDHWRKQVEQLELQLPQMQSLAQYQQRPKIEVFEGDEALIQAYDELKPNLYNKKEIIFFGTILSAYTRYREQADYYLKFVKDKRTRGRELLSHTPADYEFARRVEALDNPNYQMRFLDKKHAQGKNECAILGQRVYLFDMSTTPMVVVIDSKEIANTHRAVFEQAWSSAQTLARLSVRS